MFMFLYASALRRARFIMVNSSWTRNHVDSILNHKDFLLNLTSRVALLSCSLKYGLTDNNKPLKSSRIVYPPCETNELTSFPLTKRERVILSVAQFR